MEKIGEEGRGGEMEGREGEGGISPCATKRLTVHGRSGFQYTVESAVSIQLHAVVWTL